MTASSSNSPANINRDRLQWVQLVLQWANSTSYLSWMEMSSSQTVVGPVASKGVICPTPLVDKTVPSSQQTRQLHCLFQIYTSHTQKNVTINIYSPRWHKNSKKTNACYGYGWLEGKLWVSNTVSPVHARHIYTGYDGKMSCQKWQYSSIPEPLIDDRNSNWCIRGPRAPNKCEGRPRASNRATPHYSLSSSIISRYTISYDRYHLSVWRQAASFQQSYTVSSNMLSTATAYHVLCHDTQHN